MAHQYNVAIFGGSFNPPTIGHIKVAEAVIDQMRIPIKDTNDYSRIHQVIFIPCDKHAFDKELVRGRLRHNMLDIGIWKSKYGSKFDVSDIEIDTRTEGKTFNTLMGFKERNSQSKFYCVIGMDCALEIEKWYNWKELINTFPFIVAPRKGYKPDPIYNWFDNPPHIVLKMEDVDVDYSSTEAREAIKKHDEELMRKYLYEDIIKYIESEGLYSI